MGRGEKKFFMIAKQNQLMQQEVAGMKGNLDSQEGQPDPCRRLASAFPLPGSFWNVIWDKQTSYELSLFLICATADATGFTKGPDVIDDRIRSEREKRGPSVSLSCVKTVHSH